MKKLFVLTLAIVACSFGLKAQKFAFVDSQYILENMSEYRDAQDALDKISLDWQKEIETKFAEIDKMIFNPKPSCFRKISRKNARMIL